ncbi:DoxX family protein [Helicobacter sp. MIT 11-5569]|uniref:DoxX family protein n=1 Tax=Helicobacter sp. MIT 11-5569 TaxID=1548151 RepID=UPI00051FD1C2|nr:DoxX family protein [Helicobacter sp. MIT 11-5569]TLD83290.1 DoxX family protein [Helicobacter sp. MIT 11-5569]
MTKYKNFDLGLLFARVGLGVCFIMHGFDKIFHGIEGVKATFANHGIPEFIAYFAYVGEFAAPLMLILGVFSRVAAILVLGTVAFILFVHFPNIFTLTEHGGFSNELVFLYSAISLCILCCGSGKYALKAD